MRAVGATGWAMNRQHPPPLAGDSETADPARGTCAWKVDLGRGEVDRNLEKMEPPRDKDKDECELESTRRTKTRLGMTARDGRDVRCPKSPSLALVASKRLFFGVARPSQTAGGGSQFSLLFRLRAYI